ncbi:MAG: phage major capsid protein [Methermicoccaceae archaeon]
MAVPSSRTINYDALLSLSLEYVRDTLIDNIFTSAPFLGALYGAFGKKKKAKKGIRLVNGGERIRVPLLYGKNTTVGSYSGYDQLDVTPQDGITTAFFTWRQLSGSIAISRREERQNAGEGKIKDLLQAKIMQTEMTLRDELNNQIIGKTVSGGVWSAGAGVMNQTAGADLDPLLHLIPKDPTGSVAVGNINQSSYSWWRPVIVDGSAAHGSKDSGAARGFLCDDWATLKAAARWLYNSCSRGAGGAPDLGLLDQLTYESYEAALDEKMRYTDPKGPATAGFESIRFKGQNLVWDEMVPDVDGGYTYDSSSWASGTWLMLNTDFLELVIDSATDFITTPFVRPENQDAKVAQILFMGNLTCNNRRKQGMIYGITAGIYA